MAEEEEEVFVERRSRKRRKTMMKNGIKLPDEIIVLEILTRLPAKSLLRFKSVCKFWYSVMGMSFFIDLHHNRARTRPDGGCLLIVPTSDDEKKPMDFRLFAAEYKGGGGPARELLHYSQLGFYRISNSINGIIGLFPRYISQPVGVYNPTTRVGVRLPLATSIVTIQKYVPCFVNSNYSLGFDPISRKYKVLNMYTVEQRTPNSNRRKIISVGCEIFTLGTLDWRSLKVDPRLFKLVPPSKEVGVGGCGRRSVCVNGAIHWRTSRNDSILAFDVGEEKFRIIPLFRRRQPASLFHLMEVGGCLAIHFNRAQNNSNAEELWILEDYKKKKWNKVTLQIPLDWVVEGNGKHPLPICGIQTAKILLKPSSTSRSMADHLGCYYCCDMEGKGEGSKKLDINGLRELEYFNNITGDVLVTNHVESLFSPWACYSRRPYHCKW